MKRTRWGRERRLQKAYALDHKDEVCPDCGTPWLQLHSWPCSIEECPYEGHQLLECGHATRFWKGYKPDVEHGGKRKDKKEKKGLLSKIFGWGFR